MWGMMYIYLLTSELTYSRAIVAAESETKARQLHPAQHLCGAHISYQPAVGTDWRVQAFGGQPRAQVGYCPMERGAIPEWPDRTVDVHVTPMGRANNDIAEGVWCYEPSLMVREG